MKLKLPNFFKRSLQTKGQTAGLPYAYIQDGVLYVIGNTPNNYIKDGYLYNPLIYGAIELICRAAKKAHFKLYDVSDPDEREEVKDHTILELLKRPNPYESRSAFIEKTLGFKLLTGECFIIKVRPGMGANANKTTQLITYPPQYIKIIQDKQTGLPMTYMYSDGKHKLPIDADDVVFMKYWNPQGGIRGVSRLVAAREVLAHSNDAYHANRKLTRNMGPAGILQISDDSTEYDEAQLDQLKTKFAETYEGPANYGKVLVTASKMTWTQTGLKAEDLQIVEGQRMSLRDICNVYGFSSQLLNDPENKTYNNMQEARKALITNVVLPELHDYVDELNLQLLPEFEKADNKKYELCIDKECYEEIREDQYALIQGAAAAWWKTINEKREMTGDEPLTIPEGDDLYIPMNFVPLASGEDAESTLRRAYADAANLGTPKPKDPNQEPGQETSENEEMEPITENEGDEETAAKRLKELCPTRGAIELMAHHEGYLKAIGAKNRQKVDLIMNSGKSINGVICINQKYLNLKKYRPEDIACILTA